jgi:hypothetical protein
LHDHEVRIIYIQLNAKEHSLDLIGRLSPAVKGVLGLAFGDRSADSYPVTASQRLGASLFVKIVKDQGDLRFIYACITTFVDQLLQVAYSYVTKSCDSQYKANSVDDVTFTRSIKTGYAVELGVKAVEVSFGRV